MSDSSIEPVNVLRAGTDEAALGERIGRYILIERIGEGGAGVVYRAEDTTTGELVALKLLRTGHVADAEHRRRFLREARVTAALEHEGVVRVREVEEAGDRVFLAMDLAPGTSLRTYMDAARTRGERVSPRDAVAISRAIADAVAHAHGRGIVHRDLKPDNVMLTADLRVRVLDFGLAKLRETGGALVYNAETESNLTVDGRVLGTPAYMSPEQASGREVGFRTDVFSLGILLYEMLAGVRPFAGASTMDVIVSITRDEPPPPSTHDDRIPPELDRLVMKCLAKKAAERPDMGEVARELSGPGLALPRRRPTQRSRVAQRAAVGIALLLGCGGAFMALRRPDRQGSTPPVAALASAPTPSAAPTSLLDLPTPPSQVPEALATYRSALEDERDGAMDSALIKLDRATKLDPSLAAAHLHLAIQLAALEADSARAHFAQATKLADRLTPREREIVEAYRPLFQHDPADVDDWERRTAALADHYPNDAEIWLDVGQMQLALGGFKASVASFQRALEVDPRYGFATTQLSQAQAYVGDFAAARATVDRCLKSSPSASWCMWVREAINGEEGKCKDNEASARERIAADPTIPDGYKALYFALAAAQGRPASLVREAIEQTVKRVADPDASARLRASLEGRFDALEGDFDAAAREASELRALVAKDSDVAAHANAANLSVEVALEAGHTDEAVRLSNEFLNRRDVWAAGPIPHDYPISHDTTPFLLSIAFHDGHAMTRQTYESELSRWRTTWDKALRGNYRPYLWVYGYAPTVRSTEEAAQAIAALDAYLPIPPFLPNGRIPTIDVGHALVLAGREDEGIARLQAGTSGCDAGVSPILLVHGHAWLADALAKRGDVAGACAEYGAVLARWGHAKPRSVTADYARARRQALACDAR